MPSGLNLLSPQTFEFFARFLLAGFVMLSVRSRFVATQRPKPSEVILDAVVLSLINQFCFLALQSILDLLPLPQDGVVTAISRSRLPFFVEILVLPALLGFLFAKATGSSFANGFLRKLSMPGTHPVARAYDHAFQEHRTPSFVIVTFQDGTQVFGYFGERSLAATDTERSDIYLERLYTVENDIWTEAVPSRGALVALAELRSIEFIETETEVP